MMKMNWVNYKTNTMLKKLLTQLKSWFGFGSKDDTTTNQPSLNDDGLLFEIKDEWDKYNKGWVVGRGPHVVEMMKEYCIEVNKPHLTYDVGEPIGKFNLKKYYTKTVEELSKDPKDSDVVGALADDTKKTHTIPDLPTFETGVEETYKVESEIGEMFRNNS